MALTKVTRATTLIKDGWGAFNTLIDDLLSVANGKGASQVGIEDTAGNMSAANIEDALAEIYTDHATTKTLAETFDENPATTTGLVWGYKGGLFRLDSTVTTVAAGTIALTDDATNYIEIDPSDGLVKKNTTSFTSGRIPIRTVLTASGSQTTSTDKRAWFSQVAGATETTSGIVELATDAEFITGTATDRVVTPANAKILTTKGGDLTSANPLVIDTDGSYFDVVGTTNFASMTVAANRFFALQFDGILTMTHHATTLDLPSGADITTAAGDVAIFQSTGANTVQCISYTKVDGTSIVNASIATDVTWAAAGDLVQGTGNDTAAVLALGAANLKAFVNAGATAVEWAGGIKIGSFTRDVSTASGTQAITGVGFKPSHIVFMACKDNVVGEMSIGFDDGTTHVCIYDDYGTNVHTWTSNATKSIIVLVTATDNNTAYVSAIGADGFTLTWTKVGSPTGTEKLFYLAFR
jgi:hypothetical protein